MANPVSRSKKGPSPTKMPGLLAISFPRSPRHAAPLRLRRGHPRRPGNQHRPPTKSIRRTFNRGRSVSMKAPSVATRRSSRADAVSTSPSRACLQRHRRRLERLEDFRVRGTSQRGRRTRYEGRAAKRALALHLPKGMRGSLPRVPASKSSVRDWCRGLGALSWFLSTVSIICRYQIRSKHKANIPLAFFSAKHELRHPVSARPGRRRNFAP